MTDLYIHPERTLPKFRPLEAMRRMKLLIENKEDTEQVFRIIEALNGPQVHRRLKKFVKTEAGQAAFQKRLYLPDMLDNHEEIQKLPEGSVGRAYVDFMKREGLTAAGLVEESEKFHEGLPVLEDDLLWMMQRLRDTHDLHHILSGYGRDALGEAALLAFSHSQNGGRGVIFIAYMGCREIRRQVPRHVPIMEAFHEGRRNGRLAASLVEQDISALLHEPLDAARKRLNIQPPTKYQECLRLINESGDASLVMSPAA